MAITFHAVKRVNPTDQTPGYYATKINSSNVSAASLAADIAAVCTFTPADVKAVLSSFARQMRLHLAAGDSVHLDDLGTFSPRLKSKKIGEKDKPASRVKKILVRYTPESAIQDAVQPGASGVTFDKVK